MKKGLLLTILALLLVGGIIYSVWYINKWNAYAGRTQDLFIPNNSALVITTTSNVKISEKIAMAFKEEIERYRDQLLYKSLDTMWRSCALSASKTLSIRIEGRSRLTFLYVLDNETLMSKGELSRFFREVYKNSRQEERKYDKYRICGLTDGEETVYYSVEEGMILLSDSELYIEDALKQFERNEEKSDFTTIEKYFSVGSGLNVYVNRDFFTDILPLYLQLGSLNKNLDISKCFEWGALDGEIAEGGLMLNGFMSYDKIDASYMKAIKNQKPQEAVLDKIIPAGAASIVSLNLSDLKSYLSDLDSYRYNAGLIERVRKRKLEYTRFLNEDVETELKELLQGEFAMVNMSFDENKGEHEGAIVANLKSGGLCQAWLEKLIEKNAKYRNLHPDNYKKTYRADTEKSFTYHLFPVEDIAAIFWGDIFGNIKNSYAFVVDNYLILASSEKVVEEFIKAYMHNYSIKDAEWYQKSRAKVSAKYNLAYFSDVAKEMEYYRNYSRGKFKEILSKDERIASQFSSLTIQWSSEAEMMYGILYLSTEDIKDENKPSLLWQSKLDTRIDMKPVSVVNHITGEQEFFIQDNKNTIYLVNNSGRILWKQPVEGKINSDVYQIDALKNGKLQYLFSTDQKIHLIDRNGNPVNRFPVSFRSPCTKGITVYDYDKKRDYRIFAPCADREIYLYDLAGQFVKGWQCAKADKEIVSRVKFYRIGDKDYIVYADKYRFYIKDRKGNDRVKIAAVLDIADHTEIYQTEWDGAPVLVLSGTSGEIYVVDFSGNVRTLKINETNLGSYMNVADVSNNGQDEIIITSGATLSVYDLRGTRIYTKEFVGANLGFPYVYRFSNKDVRIGLLDIQQIKMWLLNIKEGISKGFPITGDSPFSIVFGQAGDFYLFAGADNGNFIKYRVQR